MAPCLYHYDTPRNKVMIVMMMMMIMMTVYIKELNRSKDTSAKSYKVPALQMNYHVNNLNSKSRQGSIFQIGIGKLAF